MKYVMGKKKTLESIIKFREHNLLLKLNTVSVSVDFYSLPNSFYFINL
jgi:hypothetical protein